VNRDDVQTVVKVFAKSPVDPLSFEILVRRGDDARIGALR
jgi:hypothetical protein